MRSQNQQDETDRHGAETIHLFAAMNEQWKTLLAGNGPLRAADATFERELRLNLGGGVSARLLDLAARVSYRSSPP